MSLREQYKAAVQEWRAKTVELAIDDFKKTIGVMTVSNETADILRKVITERIDETRSGGDFPNLETSGIWQTAEIIKLYPDLPLELQESLTQLADEYKKARRMLDNAQRRPALMPESESSNDLTVLYSQQVVQLLKTNGVDTEEMAAGIKLNTFRIRAAECSRQNILDWVRIWAKTILGDKKGNHNQVFSEVDVFEDGNGTNPIRRFADDGGILTAIDNDASTVTNIPREGESREEIGDGSSHIVSGK